MKPEQVRCLYSSSTPAYPAAKWIRLAATIADEGITLSPSADGLTQTAAISKAVAQKLVQAIDQAVEIAPDDPDLLVAKSAALSLSSEPDNAMAVLDQALAIAPHHFDGRMLKAHPDTWQHLFHFPSWAEGHTKLSPIMRERRWMGQQLQLVRDGLTLGVAVVNPEKREMFPDTTLRAKWDLVWMETPHGPVAVHYTMLDWGNDDIWPHEEFIPHVGAEIPAVLDNYWVLRRLAVIDSCFIVLADMQSGEVLHNERYIFPQTLRSKIRAMDNDLRRMGPTVDIDECLAAGNWYVEKYTLDSVPS